MQLYTIGHNAHPIDKFISLLKQCRIQLLIDVRSVPASRWHPQYNKKALKKVLEENQIRYEFVGQQLGGRPKDKTCYEPEAPGEFVSGPSRANFIEIMKRAWFVNGIGELVKKLSNERTAIMCSEEVPQRCHRHGLIAKYLREVYPNIDVHHIRGIGTIEGAEEYFENSEKRGPEQLSFL
jgi:uncharacterized protein (DUF488 family)